MDANNRDRKKAWKQRQRQLAKDVFPLPDALLKALFDAVDAQVEVSGCDHTLRFTESWIAEHEQSSEKILTWLREHGGFCDCEALANAADYWEQNR